MARWIRDPRLRAFQAEVRDEVERAAILAAASPYAVYIILDPSRNDPLGRHPEGTPVYVGQTKDLRDRADSHMRDGGGGTGDSSIKAGRLREMMDQFLVPVFRAVDAAPSHLTSLIAETVWARRYVWLGYDLANQWPEHRSKERPEGLASIPPKRLRRLTVQEAIEDEVTVELSCRPCGVSGSINLTTLEPLAKLSRSPVIVLTSSSFESGALLLLAFGGSRIFLRVVFNTEATIDTIFERVQHRICTGRWREEG